MRKLSLGCAVLAVGGLALGACSAGGSAAGPLKGSGGAGSGNGAGGDLGLMLPSAGAGGRAGTCDDAGLCSCMKIASIGLPAGYGNNGNDSTDAFQTWLNTKSSAQLQMITTHDAPITKELLSQYDVVIVQGLVDNIKNPTTRWTFTPDEVTAISDWVNAGGGLITMSGYTGDAREVEPVNQILSFTGLAYAADDVESTCTGSYCYCWGGAEPFSGFIQSTEVGANVSAVGVFHARSIVSNPLPTPATTEPIEVAATGATIVAEDSAANLVLGATIEVGKGRVFVFADEWVTYTSQWGGGAASDANCVGHTGDKVFQVPQFWYNTIRWASSDVACFTISDPTIVK